MRGWLVNNVTLTFMWRCIVMNFL